MREDTINRIALCVLGTIMLVAITLFRGCAENRTCLQEGNKPVECHYMW